MDIDLLNEINIEASQYEVSEVVTKSEPDDFWLTEAIVF